ncbi:MAG: YolD-like family protein [Acholeplasmatales bacterium]|nr:YolD-like family protein [Acholeplasmatales bacterium]
MEKMKRSERARQFLPFDSLKGLQQALRVKEYENERVLKGDLSEDTIQKISTSLLQIEKNTLVSVKYYRDGYYYTEEGLSKINYEKRILVVGNNKISFEMIADLEVLK